MRDSLFFGQKIVCNILASSVFGLPNTQSLPDAALSEQADRLYSRRSKTVSAASMCYLSKHTVCTPEGAKQCRLVGESPNPPERKERENESKDQKTVLAYA